LDAVYETEPLAEKQEQIRYLPALNETPKEPKENSFSFYLFGIPVFKIKKMS
jgi:hypothetical protein